MYTSAGQSHVLQYYPHLTSVSAQSRFLHQLGRYDPVRISRIFKETLKRHRMREVVSRAAHQAEVHASIAEEAAKDTLYRAITEQPPPASRDPSSRPESSSFNSSYVASTPSLLSSSCSSSSSSLSSSSVSRPHVSTSSSASSVYSSPHLPLPQEKAISSTGGAQLREAEGLLSRKNLPSRLPISSGGQEGGEADREDRAMKAETTDAVRGLPSALHLPEGKEREAAASNLFVSAALAASQSAQSLASATACTALDTKIKVGAPAILHLSGCRGGKSKEEEEEREEQTCQARSPLGGGVPQEDEEKKNEEEEEEGCSGVHTPEPGVETERSDVSRSHLVKRRQRKEPGGQGGERERGEEKAEEEDLQKDKIYGISLEHRTITMPSRCCRRTCFPPDIIPWIEEEEDLDDDSEEQGEREKKEENNQKKEDAKTEEKRQLEKSLERFYCDVRSSACPLIQLQETPGVARKHWRSVGLKLIRKFVHFFYSENSPGSTLKDLTKKARRLMGTPLTSFIVAMEENFGEGLLLLLSTPVTRTGGEVPDN